jgi:hypothetical protein
LEKLNNTAWFESPSVRLGQWREFRHSLDTDSVEDICKTVVAWWLSAPTVSMTIDPVNSEHWPTAWEMLHHGNFCDNSLALGMSYTIYYANQNISNELVYIIDRDLCVERLCALIDDKHLLNLEHSAISTFPRSNSLITYRQNIKNLV